MWNLIQEIRLGIQPSFLLGGWEGRDFQRWTWIRGRYFFQPNGGKPVDDHKSTFTFEVDVPGGSFDSGCWNPTNLGCCPLELLSFFPFFSMESLVRIDFYASQDFTRSVCSSNFCTQLCLKERFNRLNTRSWCKTWCNSMPQEKSM